MFGSHYFFQLCIVFCLILLHLFRVGLGFVVLSVRFALFALVCFALLATVFPFGFALFALVCFAFFALVCLSLFAFGAVFSVYWVAVSALVGGAFVALASFFAFVALHGCRLALLALMCGCSSVVMVAWCAWRQLGGVLLIERKQLGGLVGVEIVLRHHVVGFLLCQVGGCAFVFLAVVAVLCLCHRGTAQCDDH